VPSTAFTPHVRTEDVRCQAVASAQELEVHHRIRHEVFVLEQELFRPDDRDAVDAALGTVHVLGYWRAEPVGAVRLYPLVEPGLWKGDRLAVLPAFRALGVGPPLVRFAVRHAASLGGRRMVAQIQPQNVVLFERLGWRRVGEIAPYAGRPHQQMDIDLASL
jgi:putative N-acetyltransferase (TIGR04045 family)